jgi:hypothetical protein
MGSSCYQLAIIIITIYSYLLLASLAHIPPW